MKKKSMIVGAALLAGLLISGCANNRELIATSSLSIRNDVYSETSSAEVESGKAVADINFSVKRNASRFAGIYFKHSKPPYRVQLNIDGQTISLEAEPVLEDKSPIDSNIPESGTGWKYQFNKRIALTPGKHQLTIALPVDDVICERELDVRSGFNTITVIPVYNYRSLRPYQGQNFTAGVKDLEVIVK